MLNASIAYFLILILRKNNIKIIDKNTNDNNNNNININNTNNL